MPVTPAFLFDLESRMRHIVEDEYVRMGSSDVLWWDEITRLITSGSRRELVTWILNTAYLEEEGPSGGLDFEDMTVLEHSFEAKGAGKGLKLKKTQFDDLDGNGVYIVSEWSKQIGAQHAYWPQRQIAKLLREGETGQAYDKRAFFANNHPNNPHDPPAGTFSNLLVGNNYRIDPGVPFDTAHDNLARVYAHIASLKMPNGRDPRFLRPGFILTPPSMWSRAVTLVGAEFISASSAGGGGGTLDVKGVISKLGYQAPRQSDELAGFEDETSYFVFARQTAGSTLGAFGYVEREPFSIRFYTGQNGAGAIGIDAILDRTDELEWHTKGRNVAAYGHPWLVFKVKAS